MRNASAAGRSRSGDSGHQPHCMTVIRFLFDRMGPSPNIRESVGDTATRSKVRVADCQQLVSALLQRRSGRTWWKPGGRISTAVEPAAPGGGKPPPCEGEGRGFESRLSLIAGQRWFFDLDAVNLLCRRVDRAARLDSTRDEEVRRTNRGGHQRPIPLSSSRSRPLCRSRSVDRSRRIACQ
jgi:hypothetical protein